MRIYLHHLKVDISGKHDIEDTGDMARVRIIVGTWENTLYINLFCVAPQHRNSLPGSQW